MSLNYHEMWETQIRVNEALLAENQRMRAALEWFRDLKHDTLIIDINRRAREALERGES